MSGEVIVLRPAQAEVEDAWAAYDAARLRVEDLYRDPESTPAQRREAVMAAERLHQEFRRLYARSEAL